MNGHHAFDASADSVMDPAEHGWEAQLSDTWTVRSLQSNGFIGRALATLPYSHMAGVNRLHLHLKAFKDYLAQELNICL